MPYNICRGRLSFSDYVDRNEFFLIDFGYSRKFGITIKSKKKTRKNTGYKILHEEE